ncbi:DUF4405 domain-containing protein [Thiosulfatihalobacter marinus]|uniref:DUF4405 domain-containing protein n=1 Tax=Thiosulfatihalobacter marinus TaxID=2792481 RepID=UPI001E47007A|nr:DUF4405 domain-containing protein [Thiosulfatihalobacter marinus]
MSGTSPVSHTRPKVNSRALSLFGVTFSSMVMLISGLVLFLAPRGKLANSLDWQVMGIHRQLWSDIHIVMTALFVAVALWHAALHWRSFKTMILGNRMRPRGYRREALAGLCLVIGLVALTLLGWPPASWLVDLNEAFKNGILVK